MLFVFLLCILCMGLEIETKATPWSEINDLRLSRDVETSGWMGNQWTRVKNWFKNVGSKFRGFSQGLTHSIESLCDSVKKALKQYGTVVNSVCKDGQFEFCKYLKETPDKLS
ncbi:hypothetical protein FQR65_LT09754 [Abscondita terminalis]|nr:hypothetical protein FQR65_LT09754 [Abscondita terminalis]